jgi:hypothetical protein
MSLLSLASSLLSNNGLVKKLKQSATGFVADKLKNIGDTDINKLKGMGEQTIKNLLKANIKEQQKLDKAQQKLDKQQQKLVQEQQKLDKKQQKLAKKQQTLEEIVVRLANGQELTQKQKTLLSSIMKLNQELSQK